MWGSGGMKSLLYVSKGMKYNATFFVESVIPELMEYVYQESRQKTLRGIMLHLDNARPHNNRKNEAALTAAKARRIPAPAYSPGLSPSTFFFGMPKERVSGTSYSSPDELISAISKLIASLPKHKLGSVYKNRMKRLNWVIKHQGEYHRK
jgi:transposase